HPLIVRVACEVLRLLRRAPQMREPLGEDVGEFEGLEWQLSRLEMLEPVLTDYCQEAAEDLRASLANARGTELRGVLRALNDLRAEAAAEILQVLESPKTPYADLMLEVLTWSRDPRVGPWLRAWAARRVGMKRRASWRRQPLPPRRSSVPADF